MIINSLRRGRNSRVAALSLGTGLVLSLLASGVLVSSASAVLVSPQEHWKYNVKWRWDPDTRTSIGLIDPTIIIENRTADRINGYIGDANGTRLTMYNDEQVVMVRFGYDGGLVSQWEAAGRFQNGYFSVEVPSQYADADTVSFYIGNNQYTVDAGTWTTPQPSVFINSARLDYRTNSTMITGNNSTGQNETATANDTTTNATASSGYYYHHEQDDNTKNGTEATASAWKEYSSGSLIDFILTNKTSSSVGSPNSGKQ